MNKPNRTRMIVTLLVLMLISTALFAAGAKEAHPDAVTVRVLSSFDQQGQRAFTVRTLENVDFVFMTNSMTESTYPVASISRGDYLEVVVNNGIASDIRYINPLVATGILPTTSALHRQQHWKVLRIVSVTPMDSC